MNIGTEHDTEPDTNRRQFLRYAGAVALLGGLGGLGAAWWRQQSGALGTREVVADKYWQMRFSTLDGPRQSLAQLREARGASTRYCPLLINFWASWCTPCIEEMPLLNDFYRKNRPENWQVVGVAVDTPESVRAFLQQHPVDFPILLASAEGQAMSQDFGNQVGGLPFSALINRDPEGLIVASKIGRLRQTDLEAWAGLV